MLEIFVTPQILPPPISGAQDLFILMVNPRLPQVHLSQTGKITWAGFKKSTRQNWQVSKKELLIYKLGFSK